MLLMNQMQQRMALWITGAFRTSPTTAIEAISGLMPIHLYLSKLAQRSSVHTLTLHRTHAVHVFTGLYPECGRHPLSPMSITPRQANQAKGPLIEAAMCQLMPNKPLVPLPDESMPGRRQVFLDSWEIFLSCMSCLVFMSLCIFSSTCLLLEFVLR
jgi:hypothetical protein